MRLGRVILQTCAALIALAVVVGGYVLYREQQVSTYRVDILQGLPVSNLSALMYALDAAPSMTCTESHSDFNSASQVALYHADERTRIIFTSLTSRETQHWVIDQSDLYLWSDSSDSIVRVSRTSAEALVQIAEALPPLFVNAECGVWWMPEDRAFDVPADRPLIEFRG